MLFKEHYNSSPLNSTTHYAIMPNGDRIVAVDFVTSFHPMYSAVRARVYFGRWPMSATAYAG